MLYAGETYQVPDDLEDEIDLCMVNDASLDITAALHQVS